MPENDLKVLIEAARAAGDVARRFNGPSAKLWHKPDDAGPVTEADLAVNELLHQRLMQARPDYGWLSEETEDGAARLHSQRVFVIDPIDGTRSFIKGDDTWAHALAVADRGQVTAAVVYLPMLDKLYSAAIGRGAFLNGQAITATDSESLAEAQVLTTRTNLEPQHWRGAVPVFQRHHRPSIAYRLALIAEGRFEAMFTFRNSWEWDIAAGALIATEAGATVTDKNGVALRFNNPKPQSQGIVAAGAKLHPQIASYLAYTA